MRAFLLLCLLVPLAPSTSAQTLAERLAAGMCSVDPNLSIDGDGLLRIGNPAEPDSSSGCFVSYERSPGGVATLRMRLTLPYAVYRQIAEAAIRTLAESTGDTALESLTEPIARLLAHAVAAEVEQSVRCSTGEALRTSAGFYDLTGVRLLEAPTELGLDRALTGQLRRLCEIED